MLIVLSDTTLRFHFAHANGFPAPSYNALFSALPSHFTHVNLDRFGHNPSLPVNRNWRNQVDELIHHVKATQQGADRVYAVGHSLGAVVSYMAVCEAPSLFKGLIMLDPPLVVGPMSSLLRVVKRTPLIDRITPAGLSKSRNSQWPLDTNMEAYFSEKALFRDMDRRCIRDYIDASTHLGDKQITLTFKPDVETALFRNVPHNLNRYKGKLQCPGLLVTAKQRSVCHPLMLKMLKRQNPIEHTTMEGGHMFPLENPEQVASLIAATLTRWDS